MAPEINMLRSYLEDEKWVLAAAVAQDLLTRPDLSPPDRAFAYHAACTSLLKLQQYTPALQHGHAATEAALAVSDFDLLGKTLMEVAYLQQQLGRHDEAIQTLLDFGKHLPRYTQAVARSWPKAQVNRGISLRTTGEYEGALQAFLAAQAKARAEGDVQTAEYARSQAAWVALELGRVDQAETLITQGKAYLDRFPDDAQAQARQLIDRAWLARLRREYPEGINHAIEAAYCSRQTPDLFAEALLNLHYIAKALGEHVIAFQLGLLAKHLAELGEADFLLQLLRASLVQLLFQHRSELEHFARELLEPRRSSA